MARPDVVLISEGGGRVVDILHRKSDGGMWIVRRWKKFLWMKKLVSRDWFNDESQALAFARAPETARGSAAGRALPPR